MLRLHNRNNGPFKQIKLRARVEGLKGGAKVKLFPRLLKVPTFPSPSSSVKERFKPENSLALSVKDKI